MSAQHTPGRLAQGRTLTTRVTERWTKEEWDRNEAREKCLVFTHYTPIDQGLGRKLVAQCHQGPEDARRLAACWNACDGISTESLERGPTPTEAFQREKARADLAERRRDELVKALRDLLDVVTGQKEGEAVAVMNASAALNKIGSTT